MYIPEAKADDILEEALSAFRSPDAPLLSVLDELPAPIYVADADGFIIHFNPACTDFAGRKPVVGQDRWCVTWKLFTNEGEFLPHDECPMAVAIKTKEVVRDVTAIAERPDGTRVEFKPYPTPLFDTDGEFIGAINLLIDVTDARQAESLIAQARRCRRLANSVTDRAAIKNLLAMADDCEAKAEALRKH